MVKGRGRVALVTWRTLSIVLAVIGALTGIVLLLGGQVWNALACFVCAVVFGMEGAGISTLGRTRRAMRELREQRERDGKTLGVRPLADN
ncbi:hypothetical protein ACFL51_01325 [Myxococcota bacterium]